MCHSKYCNNFDIIIVDVFVRIYWIYHSMFFVLEFIEFIILISLLYACISCSMFHLVPDYGLLTWVDSSQKLNLAFAVPHYKHFLLLLVNDCLKLSYHYSKWCIVYWSKLFISRSYLSMVLLSWNSGNVYGQILVL